MGVRQGVKALYHVINLIPAEIAACYKGLYDEARAKGKLPMKQATLDADCNNLCMKLASNEPTESKTSVTAATPCPSAVTTSSTTTLPPAATAPSDASDAVRCGPLSRVPPAPRRSSR